MASKFLCEHKFLERLLNGFSKIYVNIKHENSKFLCLNDFKKT